METGLEIGTQRTSVAAARMDLDAATPALVHDLRGMIGVAKCLVVQAARLIEMGQADEALKMLAKIDTTTVRSAALCGDILECSRRRACGDAFELARTTVDLVELVREQISLHTVLFVEKRCEVRLFAPEDPAEVIVSTHRRSIERILSNLLQNASRYGAGRPVDVHVSANRRGAVLVVRDRGAGIPAEQLSVVPTPYQSSGAQDHCFERFGLGLWIVQSLVESLGGLLHVVSKAELGTAITIALPLMMTEASANATMM